MGAPALAAGAGHPARETRPAFRHFVQTERRLGTPFTMARTFWMLGFQRLGERRCECDTCMPNMGVFPQMSQTAAIARAW